MCIKGKVKVKREERANGTVRGQAPLSVWPGHLSKRVTGGVKERVGGKFDIALGC